MSLLNDGLLNNDELFIVDSICVCGLTEAMFTVAVRWMIQTGTSSFSRKPLPVNAMVQKQTHLHAYSSQN